mmetsp:Transcript_16069/g.61268  ORF Transcript_16069/g.61268 Transcript_16069/m.61268 type:complete len:221 (-) Transcript_16069:74-736(-)
MVSSILAGSVSLAVSQAKARSVATGLSRRTSRYGSTMARPGTCSSCFWMKRMIFSTATLGSPTMSSGSTTSKWNTAKTLPNVTTYRLAYVPMATQPYLRHSSTRPLLPLLARRRTLCCFSSLLLLQKLRILDDSDSLGGSSCSFPSPAAAAGRVSRPRGSPRSRSSFIRRLLHARAAWTAIAKRPRRPRQPLQRPEKREDGGACIACASWRSQRSRAQGS